MHNHLYFYPINDKVIIIHSISDESVVISVLKHGVISSRSKHDFVDRGDGNVDLGQFYFSINFLLKIRQILHEV